uniref:Liver-expressed antimicrobial peptide 2 n=1 Tax=Sphaeramia orbicularis TaxID=375764 RepID=A0A673AZL7_9TELE
MQGFFTQRKATAVCVVLLIVIQQVCTGPVVSLGQSSDPEPQVPHRVHTPRRTARMTPLWRIMNSKPFGAYCQNHYECSTGLCSNTLNFMGEMFQM